MNNKKNIAVIAGGDSSEKEVSYNSARGLLSFLDDTLYNLYLLIIDKDRWAVKIGEDKWADIDKNNFSFNTENQLIKIDFAYITIHGTPGENGKLQGYFDLIGIPYSSCNLLASALTFNKFTCNNYLRSFGVRIADSIRLFRGNTIDNEELISRLNLPVFVKPNDGGSSCGASKVKTPEEIQPAIRKAFEEGDEVLIESFMPGTEVTCGCYKVKDKLVIFPITEVVSKNEFFDYEAKYIAEKVDEITPARISSELTEEIKQLTGKIYDLIGAKGIIRVDFIISPEGVVRMLEVNTVPGMTVTSFIPQQIKAAGLDIRTVLTEIIENELNVE